MYVFVYIHVAQEAVTRLMWVFVYNLVFEITNPDQRLNIVPFVGNGNEKIKYEISSFSALYFH